MSFQIVMFHSRFCFRLFLLDCLKIMFKYILVWKYCIFQEHVLVFVCMFLDFLVLFGSFFYFSCDFIFVCLNVLDVFVDQFDMFLELLVCLFFFLIALFFVFFLMIWDVCGFVWEFSSKVATFKSSPVGSGPGLLNDTMHSAWGYLDSTVGKTLFSDDGNHVCVAPGTSTVWLQSQL